VEDQIGERLKVGISWSGKFLGNWIQSGGQDAENMKAQLEALDYAVDLQYGGDNDVVTQISQIENMISGGCQVLVIFPIDGGTLTEVLAKAKSNNIPVIAYERLIMETDAVSYYITFDNRKVGVLQGEYIRDTLGLDTATEPLNIELFTGDPGDNNINFFFGGAMSVLKPYIDSGKLAVKSGQTTQADCATPGWRTADAQTRMESLISQCGYTPTGTPLAAVLSSNDSVAQGISNALKTAGYTADNFPVITGMDCDRASVINMRNGEQDMSVFKDTRLLTAATVRMVYQILSGDTVTVNDRKTYDNGKGLIPTYLCEPTVYTIKNIGKLVESDYAWGRLRSVGYYDWADIGGEKGTLPLDYQIEWPNGDTRTSRTKE
jgi:putative multiple sugar transport system substrate-binding protein